MKRVTTVLFSSMLLLCQPLLLQTKAAPQTIDHGGTIDSKYDGFKHETVITLRKMRIICGDAKGVQTPMKGTCVSVVASLHAPGKQLDYVRNATLQLIFETQDWDRRHSPNERDLSIVADGETIRVGRMDLVKQGMDNNPLIESMKEVLEVSLSYENFNKIVRAEFVEMKVGNSEFALQAKNLAALRDLNNRVKF